MISPGRLPLSNAPSRFFPELQAPCLASNSSFAGEIFEKLAREAARLVVPGDLAKHAVSNPKGVLSSSEVACASF